MSATPLSMSEAAGSRVSNSPVHLGVLALARNCEATLPGFFAWLRDLEQQGFCCTIWVGENGSSDKTRELLEAAAGPNFTVLDTGFMSGIPSRLSRMAMGREALLRAAAQAGLDASFVCVVDLDNVMASPPSPTTLRTALRYLDDSTIFAVGATSDPFYYDLLSLQAEGHDCLSLQGEIDEAKKHPASYFKFHRDRIYRNQRRLTLSSPLACTSSFNGLCLYRAGDFFKGSYRSPEEQAVCEHVSFNLSIARATGRTMLVVPELRLLMPQDHGPVGFLRFWADRLRKALHR